VKTKKEEVEFKMKRIIGIVSFLNKMSQIEVVTDKKFKNPENVF
jgi:hypothetical protein